MNEWLDSRVLPVIADVAMINLTSVSHGHVGDTRQTNAMRGKVRKRFPYECCRVVEQPAIVVLIDRKLCDVDNISTRLELPPTHIANPFLCSIIHGLTNLEPSGLSRIPGK